MLVVVYGTDKFYRFNEPGQKETEIDLNDIIIHSTSKQDIISQLLHSTRIFATRTLETAQDEIFQTNWFHHMRNTYNIERPKPSTPKRKRRPNQGLQKLIKLGCKYPETRDTKDVTTYSYLPQNNAIKWFLPHEKSKRKHVLRTLLTRTRKMTRETVRASKFKIM